jgi:hypothetical protein
VTVLADNGPGDGVAGPLGLLIIVLLVIATVLLMRNMNARLRRLPTEFPDPSAAPEARPDADTEVADDDTTSR